MKLINVSSVDQSSNKFNAKISNINIEPFSEIAFLKGRSRLNDEIHIDDSNNTFVIQYGGYGLEEVSDPEPDPDNSICYLKPEIIKIKPGSYKKFGRQTNATNTISEAMALAMNEQSNYIWFGQDATYANANDTIRIRNFIKDRQFKNFEMQTAYPENTIIDQNPIVIDDLGGVAQLYMNTIGQNEFITITSENRVPIPFDSRDHTILGANDFDAYPILDVDFPPLPARQDARSMECGLITTEQKIHSQLGNIQYKFISKIVNKYRLRAPIRIHLKDNSNQFRFSLYNTDQNGQRENFAILTEDLDCRWSSNNPINIKISVEMDSIENAFKFHIITDDNALGGPNPQEKIIRIPDNWINPKGYHSVVLCDQNENAGNYVTVRGVTEDLLDNNYDNRIGYIDEMGTANAYNNVSLGKIAKIFFVEPADPGDRFNIGDNIIYSVSNDLSILTRECNLEFADNEDLDDFAYRQFVVNDTNYVLVIKIYDPFHTISSNFYINVNNLPIESYTGNNIRGIKTNTIFVDYGQDHSNQDGVIHFTPTNLIYYKLNNTEVITLSNLDITITDQDGNLHNDLEGTSFLSFVICQNQNAAMLRALGGMANNKNKIEVQQINEKLNTLINKA